MTSTTDALLASWHGGWHAFRVARQLGDVDRQAEYGAELVNLAVVMRRRIARFHARRRSRIAPEPRKAAPTA